MPVVRLLFVRRISYLLAILLSVAVLAVAGIGWYFSGVAMQIDRADAYEIEVLQVGGESITLQRTVETERPGRFGIATSEQRAIVGDVLAEDATSVTRSLAQPTEIAAGDRIHWDDDVWEGDPRVVGVEYEEVMFPSEVGDLPAWLVTGDDDTWVIAVHGRSGSRSEALRALPTLAATGMPVLVISYRNDEGAPEGGKGNGHLGASEWRDVDAAIEYAKKRGAKDVVLYGWSMGGAMTTRALFASSHAESISALVLDAPVLDWRDTLDSQAADRGLPLPVTRVAEQILSWRTGLDYDDFDQVRHADRLDVPVLIFYGRDDDYVPSGPAGEFSDRRPDLVRLEWFDHAGHTESWNVDPARYERHLQEFLSVHAEHVAGP